MKFTKQIVAVLLVALTITACKTDYKKTKEGFPYTVFTSGSGDKIKPGDYVSFHLTRKLDDSVLNTTYGRFPQTVPLPTDSAMLEDVKIFLEARKGDSILVIQPIDSILKMDPQASQNPLFAKNKGKSIKIYIKIVDVFKDQAAANEGQEKQAMEEFRKDTAVARQRAIDETEIDAYLKAKGITTTRTPWGAYMQVVTPGNGQKPKNGQFVSLRYVGKFLNGEVFETNTKPADQPMVMQLGRTSLIPGFNDAVKQMSKGEKAIVYIPSIIGYGQQGGQPDEKGVQVIKPNTNLIFELEVLDITDKEPTPPTPPTTSQPDTTRK